VIIQLAQNSEEWHTTDEAGFLWKARVVMTDPLSEYRANGPFWGFSLTVGFYVMPVTVMQHCQFKHTLGLSCKWNGKLLIAIRSTGNLVKDKVQIMC
jgi:hypothetical protein